MLYRSYFTRFSAFIFVFLLLQSCTQGVQYEAEHQLEVRLNGRNNYEPFPLSDIVDSSSVIHIQCDPPAGNVTDVKFQHGCYYLLDNLNNAVVKVDSLGRTCMRLERRGRAEGEYVHISCFDVNPANGEISVYDGSQQKMIVYASDGSFLRSFSMADYWPATFAVYPDGSYLFYKPDYEDSKTIRGIWTADADGQFRKQLYSIPGSFRFCVRSFVNNRIERLSDSTFGIISPEYDNLVFHVTGEEITPYFQFVVDKVIPKSVARKENVPMKEMKATYSKQIYAESARAMIVGFFNHVGNGGIEESIVYYDKVKGKAFVTSPGTHIENTVVKLWDVAAVQSYGDRFYSVIESDFLSSNPSFQQSFPYDPGNLNPYIVVSYSK